jgi:hypothetical protein
LNEYDYEVLQLSDYVNGIAISKMLQHGTAETVIEMILPGETEMFSWMKNLIRIQALKQNKAGDHSLVETVRSSILYQYLIMIDWTSGCTFKGI